MKQTIPLSPHKIAAFTIMMSIAQTSLAVPAVTSDHIKKAQDQQLQEQRERFHQLMSRYTSVETLPPNKDYFLQKLLKTSSTDSLLKSVGIMVDNNSLSKINTVIERLQSSLSALEREMKLSVCNQFVEQPIEQINAVDIAKTVESFEQQLIEAQHAAVNELKTIFSPLQLSQMPKQRHSVSKRIRTDYLTMAKEEPEFFKEFTHERCLLQAAKNRASFTPEQKSIDTSSTSQSITIDFVRD